MTYHDDYISGFMIDLFNSISVSFVHLTKFQTVYFILRKREDFLFELFIMIILKYKETIPKLSVEQNYIKSFDSTWDHECWL